MGDIFGRFVAVVVAITLLCTVILGNIRIRIVKTENLYIREYMKQFCEQMARAGEIRQKDWERVVQDINRSTQYNAELLIGRYSASGTGGYMVVTYGDELETRLSQDGVYRLERGDVVMYRLTRKSETGEGTGNIRWKHMKDLLISLCFAWWDLSYRQS